MINPCFNDTVADERYETDCACPRCGSRKVMLRECETVYFMECAHCGYDESFLYDEDDEKEDANSATETDTP